MASGLTVAGLAVTSLAAAGISLRHADLDAPQLHASDVHAPTLHEALRSGAGTGALLVDLVEPAEGEGSSEAELASLAASLRQRGYVVEPAGPYSEGEHLLRVVGDEAALARLERELASRAEVEGVEGELLYALPDEALSAYQGPLQDLQDQTGAHEVGPHKPNPPRFVPNDPMYPLQWHLDAIRVPEAWTITKGRGATIAVIDTGVAWKDLQWKNIDARAVPDLAGIEFVDGQTFLDNALPDGLDDHAHGTHVAGTIAQSTNNGLGVAGVAHQAKVMPLKVLAGDGRGSVASIANAIRWAADHKANVINMSLGGPLPSRVMAKAVEYAYSKGVVVVCAAGNEKRSRVSYPAAYPGSFAVASVDLSGKRAFYSNWGKELDISAPGGDTRSDENGDGHPDGVLQNTIRIQDPSRNDYLWFMGTSMAAPHVAGVAGLVVSMGVTNPKEVEKILQSTAKHPNNKKWDDQYGAGVVDAHAAVQAAKSSQYGGERLSLLAGLGLLLVGSTAGASSGSTSGATRRRLREHGAAAIAALLAAGAFTVPLAYGVGLGVGGLASGLWLSVIPPLLATLLLLSVRSIRPLLAGLSLGWAALLAHGALVLPTILDALPGGMLVDRWFLAVQAVLCAMLAARIYALPTRPDDAV